METSLIMDVVAELLHALDYSGRPTRGHWEGSQHADRDEQFEYINRRAQPYLKQGSGGSNGARVRLWKWGLQKLADEIGLEISLCHFPPGTNQWEQDRTSAVLFHKPELAGKPPNQSR